MLTDALIALLILLGAGFVLIGAVGLIRLPDFFTRLHAPTKASTLGVGSILVASMLYFSTRNDSVSLHELLVIAFLFITAPVSAHLMSKAALHLKPDNSAQMKAQDGIEKQPWVNSNRGP